MMDAYGQFAVGQTVDRFRIDGELGRGGFGVVYAATGPSGEPVAIKVLRERFASDERLARFQRETSLAARLHHPNIVTPVGFGETEAQFPYIVFERLVGWPLYDWLRQRGRVDWQTAAQIGRQVLSALVLAHAQGVVHRDIKPANLFVCEGPKLLVKVLDFGIAKVFEQPGVMATQLTATGQMLGTPRYMAPEQVRGDPVDPRADLYALGLVLIELIQGTPVLDGASELDVLLQHLKGEEHVLPPLVMQSPLAGVLAQAVRKSPAERVASASEMMARLGAAAGVRRRARWPWVVAALSLLAAAGAGGAMLLRSNDSPKATSSKRDRRSPARTKVEDAARAEEIVSALTIKSLRDRLEEAGYPVTTEIHFERSYTLKIDEPVTAAVILTDHPDPAGAAAEANIKANQTSMLVVHGGRQVLTVVAKDGGEAGRPILEAIVGSP